MKRLMLLIVVVLLLTACSAAPSAPAQADAVAGSNLAVKPASTESTPVPPSVQANAAVDVELMLSTGFADATNLRNQLAYGTLQLDGTELAVTAEQAKALLPLWQAMAALSGESATVSEELNAVQTQIMETLTAEQLQAIAALKITNTQLSAYYESKGIVMPTPVPGVTKVPGSMKNLAPEVRAATQAAREASGAAGTGTGQLTKTLLYDEVIEMLSKRAAE